MARLKPIWFIALAVACLLMAAYQGYAWYRMDRLQRAILDPAGIVVDETTPPELVYAKAWHLERRGTNSHGDHTRHAHSPHPNPLPEGEGVQGCCDSNIEEAIRLYASLQRTDDKALRARVLYNLGTIYLKDGAKLWNARGVLEYARVNTLVELAKEYYRDSLRLDPGNWDARHNLEYAWRITPPPREKAKSDLRGSKSSVFSTLPGIPGGGP